MKQSGHDFFHDYYWILKQWGSLNGQGIVSQRLYDGYYMDIMWCSYVEVDIQQKAVQFCEKASLRISYIILFEWKRPWMLKTDSLIF